MSVHDAIEVGAIYPDTCRAVGLGGPRPLSFGDDVVWRELIDGAGLSVTIVPSVTPSVAVELSQAETN